MFPAVIDGKIMPKRDGTAWQYGAIQAKGTVTAWLLF
jgi:hypothetical protein